MEKEITERKEAEDTLKQSIEWLAAILESSRDGIIVQEGERVVYANKAFACLYGYTGPEEVIGGPTSRFLTPDDYKRMREFGENRLQNESAPPVYEFKGVRKDGTVVEHEASVSTFTNGGKVYIITNLRDITARRAEEEALRAVVEGTASAIGGDFFASLVRHLAAALHVKYAFVAACVNASKTKVRTLAFWNTEAFGSNFEYDLAGTPCEQVVAGETCYHSKGVQALFPHDKDLVTLQAESYLGVPVVGSSGDIIGHLAVLDDKPASEQSLNTSVLKIFAARAGAEIERLGAEEALRESEQRLRAIFNSEPECVKIVAADGTLLEMNPAGLAMIEAESREQVINKMVSDFVHPDDVTAVLGLHQAACLGQSGTASFRVIGLKGGLRWMEAHSVPLRDHTGEIVSVLNVARDVTERRRTEEALHMTEEQLRQSQKLESVGRLAGGIAHDFNNMLTVITGYSELLLKQLGPVNPLSPRVEEIMKAGERASTLTYQLLAFSRKQILQPKVLDLNTVISDTDKMLQRLIGEDIQLLAILNPMVGHVEADPGQITQVIMNLVINARDAMPQGGKLIIETANVYLDEAYARQHIAVKPGVYVMLAVSDTGTGMSAETREQIFEPFFTTKEGGKGTGLGLSTVYGIVKQSGGNIWVYSEVGHGTTFKIYLPRVDEEVESTESTAAATDLPRGTEKVMLVEDEDMVRLLAQEILEMCGYSVLSARDGAEAISICDREECEIDLLITDVVMPKISGRELTQLLMESRPQMRVLYMSGYTSNAIVHHGVLEEGTYFLQKPFTPYALALKVREVLEQP